MSDLPIARALLVALLVLSTALFAIGVVAERSDTSGHVESAAQHARETGESPGESESDERQASPAAHDEHETLLGIDVESTPLIILAVIAGLGLALLAASAPGRRPAVLFTIAVVMLAWAALDVREVVHQINESRTGLAILAIAVTLLHLAAAALATLLAARGRAGAGSPSRPGTMPA
jgi:hypothetical protein